MCKFECRIKKKQSDVVKHKSIALFNMSNLAFFCAQVNHIRAMCHTKPLHCLITIVVLANDLARFPNDFGNFVPNYEARFYKYISSNECVVLLVNFTWLQLIFYCSQCYIHPLCLCNFS